VVPVCKRIYTVSLANQVPNSQTFQCATIWCLSAKKGLSNWAVSSEFNKLSYGRTNANANVPVKLFTTGSRAVTVIVLQLCN